MVLNGVTSYIPAEEIQLLCDMVVRNANLSTDIQSTTMPQYRISYLRVCGHMFSVDLPIVAARDLDRLQHLLREAIMKQINQAALTSTATNLELLDAVLKHKLSQADCVMRPADVLILAEI